MLAVLREKISVRLGRGPDGEEGLHFVPTCSDDRIRSAQLSALLIPAESEDSRVHYLQFRQSETPARMPARRVRARWSIRNL